MIVEEIELARLVRRPEWQPRMREDEILVARMATWIEGAAPGWPLQLPPITVTKEGMLCVILDGHHRFLAAQRAGRLTVPAFVSSSVAHDEAMAHAAAANTQNPLSTAEHGRLIAALSTKYGWSYTRYAKHVGRTTSWASNCVAIWRMWCQHPAHHATLARIDGSMVPALQRAPHWAQVQILEAVELTTMPRAAVNAAIKLACLPGATPEQLVGAMATTPRRSYQRRTLVSGRDLEDASELGFQIWLKRARALEGLLDGFDLPVLCALQAAHAGRRLSCPSCREQLLDAETPDGEGWRWAWPEGDQYMPGIRILCGSCGYRLDGFRSAMAWKRWRDALAHTA